MTSNNSDDTTPQKSNGSVDNSQQTNQPAVDNTTSSAGTQQEEQILALKKQLQQLETQVQELRIKAKHLQTDPNQQKLAQQCNDQADQLEAYAKQLQNEITKRSNQSQHISSTSEMASFSVERHQEEPNVPQSQPEHTSDPNIVPPASDQQPQASPDLEQRRKKYLEDLKQQTTSPDGWRRLLHFTATGGGLFSIYFINALLTIFTLGIYSFWGKVRVRKYLCQNIHLWGHPLYYTGTGLELFVSFLIIIIPFFLLMVVMQILITFAGFIGILLTIVLFAFLIHLAIYRTIRYRLTRIHWRGLRGNLAGSSVQYALKAMGYELLLICSLGILTPWVVSQLGNLVYDNIYLGNRKCSFQSTTKGLFGPFFIALLLNLLALGMFGGLIAFMFVMMTLQGWAFSPDQFLSEYIGLFILVYIGSIFFMLIAAGIWHAAYIRWFFHHLKYSKMDMRSTLGAKKLVFIHLTNLLILIFTFGIGYAWVVVRMYKAIYSSVDFTGDPEITTVIQNQQAVPARGEGLLEALEIDLGF